MKFSIRHVYGLNEARCEQTEELLSAYGIHPTHETNYESQQSVTNESTSAAHASQNRLTKVNRDDIALREWRRLAGLQ